MSNSILQASLLAMVHLVRMLLNYTVAQKNKALQNSSYFTQFWTGVAGDLYPPAKCTPQGTNRLGYLYPRYIYPRLYVPP